MNNIQSAKKATIVYVTTFPPRECGIATFTSDLIENFDKLYGKQEETKVLALSIDSNDHNKYPRRVIGRILQDEVADYEKAARMINDMPEVELVALEHEYGIYGKDYGKNVLVFLDLINKPVTVTCHTVLPNPAPEMLAVMKSIIEKVDRVIVMTKTSERILKEVYGADPNKIKVIPHGIHPVQFSLGQDAKKELCLGTHKIISTFGFLSRGKGIEYGIEAMASIAREFPEATYLIIGETHPVVKRNEGEVYREELKAQAKRLGLENKVIFIDKYLDTKDLIKYLEATDIYLSLSQNPDQAVSGTLSYALGTGRPVISTPFAQAREIITGDVGALISLQNSSDIVKEVGGLLRDEERRIALAKNAYFHTRIMTWQNVALTYMREFATLAPNLAKRQMVAPELKLSHLLELTDDFGVFQFASLNKPDPSWGYTVDDNARALVLMVWCSTLSGFKSVVNKYSKIYLNLLLEAFDGSRFANYFNTNRQPVVDKNNDENLSDTNARALWALSEVVCSKLQFFVRYKARRVFKSLLKNNTEPSSPRASALIIKSLAKYYGVSKVESLKNSLIKHADFLVFRFNETANPEWQWFEDILSYSNGLMPEALFIAYEVTGDKRYLDVAEASLQFLISQSFENTTAMPIGQAGWLLRNGKKHIYDQQPEEVCALVLALETGYRVTHNVTYKERMEQAFNWFLGNNVLNQMVYSEMTGGSYDGVTEKEVNLNQGAESTISYLLARIVISNYNNLK